ncbi:MAG: aminopeptidase P family protein [Pedobacter sp.]|nr:MAG: aminopeptidase P family protein [Pedobacter sp.]
MTYTEKLQAIRTQMQVDGVDAYIIPSADPHMSEYLPNYYKCISFTTGFRGSVSTVVITADFAGLWADSRYFEQAEAQLAGSGFELVKLKAQGMPEYIQWLAEKLPTNAKVAFDFNMVSVALLEVLEANLAFNKISFLNKDYISPIWPDRPALPQEKAFLLESASTGVTTSMKLTEIRNKMKKLRVDFHLISSLDDIAWLFNIRGKDVNYNPVVLSFALITDTEATLYQHAGKLNSEEIEELKSNGIQVKDYLQVEIDLTQIPAGKSILIDPKRNCIALYNLIPSTVAIIKETNPSTFLKAIKNEIEIANTREVMIKDGLAITKFLKWIKDNIGKFPITEISAAAQLRQFRAEQNGFIGDSFNTIAAYKAHGALPHYASTTESNVEIQAEGLFLVDSGGQYYYGTTDITRVIPMGNNTEEEAIDYTLVLKAMIEGCRMSFPKGTCGYQIDAITRRPLWEHKRNYGHGTGHGVGYYLNVHEGPQIFNPSATPIPIELGTITSIEPGLYRPNKHGIRIENLVLTVRDTENEFNEFYQFEALTLAPIDTSLVKKDLLDEQQINWLNEYHRIVFEKLNPFLSESEKEFLFEMTKAL